ncbi:O-antigen polymerase [Sporosarcina koreensis]|uniref:O-antigen polymerase n=1 Tax=Sporosarcina koreensis TaxID=334735 RepID=A0ABW0U1A9_9BACL
MERSMKKNAFNLTFLAMLIFSFYSFAYLVINVHNIEEGYKSLYLLPLSLIIIMIPTFFYLYIGILENIFLTIYFIVSFFRYSLLPYLIAKYNIYSGFSSVSPKQVSVELAIKLMSYELVITSLVIIFIVKVIINKSAPAKGKVIITTRNNYIYYLFIGFSLILLVLFPEARNFFSFVVKKQGTVHDQSSLIYLAVTMILVTAKNLLFVLIIGFFHRKYLISNSKRYVILAVLITTTNIMVFYGENRADLLITAISSLLLFGVLFKRYGKYLIILFLIMFPLLFSSLTEYRNYNGFSSTQEEGEKLANNIQVYAGGPYNVAISIEAKEYYATSSETNFLYEFFRPFIGLNILLKNSDYITSSEIFNYRIFYENNVTQIIPIIGQGYYYFGFVFSPLISIIFICISFLIYKIMKKEMSIISYYFLTISLIRLGFMMGHNSLILINELSYNLLIIFVLIFLDKKIGGNKI